MPLEDGRYGACRVLRKKEEEGDVSVLAAATPWIGSTAPSLDEPLLRVILGSTHHNREGEGKVLWISEAVPATFTRLGVLEPTKQQARLDCQTFGGWMSLSIGVFTQWRWDHDREALLEEERQQEEHAKASREKQRVAYKPLPSPGLHEMARQAAFKSWRGYVDAEILQESRAIVRATIRALLALGPDAPAAAKLDVIRECVEGFNDIDDGWICTIEREDICELIDELGARVDLDDFGEELEAWRDW
jgi:hypothetical protein